MHLTAAPRPPATHASTPLASADREQLVQDAAQEAEEEAEREEMLDSPAKRQRREEGTDLTHR